MKTQIQHFKQQIADKGLSKDLFNRIMKFVEEAGGNYSSQVLSLKARFVQIEKDREKNLIKYDDYSVERDKVINGLIGLLDEILNPDTADSEIDHKPIFLTSTVRPPLRASKVLGREEEQQKIADHFKNKNHLLLINGLGGVGKSTLAGYYMEKNLHKYRHIAWVNYTGNLKEDLSREINNYEALGISFSPNTEEMLRRQMNAMGALPASNLLIIDNINTQEQVDEVAAFERNFPIGWKVLLTSRATTSAFETHQVGVLEEKEAIDLFKRFYKFKKTDSEDDLKTLMEQVGRHTLAVEMLAKTLQAQGNWDIKKIHQNLLNKGLVRLATSNKVPTAHSRQQSKSLHSYISAIFDISLKSLNDAEKHLLLQFAVLPPFAHPFGELCQFLGKTSEEEQDAFFPQLRRLADKGFLELQSHESSNGISQDEDAFMHPILQEVIREREKPSYEKCIKMIEFFSKKLYLDVATNPLHTFSFLPYGNFLVSNIEVDHEGVATLLNNLSHSYKDKGDLDNALKFQKKYLEFKKDDIKFNHSHLADSYNNLAQIYKAKGELNNAMSYQKKAIVIREKEMTKDHPIHGISYNDLAMIYFDKGDLDNALKFQRKAYKIWSRVLDKDHPHIATAFNNLSLIYRNKNDLNNALKFQNKAHEIWKKTLDKNHPLLGTSYNNLSLIYQCKGELGNALKFQKKDMGITEKVLGKDHPLLATSYHNLSHIYYYLENYIEALKWIEQAIVILQKSFPYGHPNLDKALASQKVITNRMTTNEK